jgi:hypothetical protein
MDEKIIVLVSDEDDSKHGEISVLDDPHKAERLVETLLEAGFNQNRIRVFNGRLSDFEVSHRPVVALVDEGNAGKPQPVAKAVEPAAKAVSRQAKTEGPAVEAKTLAVEAQEPAAKVEELTAKTEAPAAEAESRQDKVEEALADVAVAKSRAQEQPENETKEEEQAPETQIAAPVRFSSLFRSA